MGNDTAAFDFGAALNRTMDQIDDLPEYIIPENGSYQVQVEVKNEVRGEGENKKPFVRWTYTVVNTLEIEGGKEAPKPDSKFSEQFGLDNDLGFGALKRHVKNVWDQNPALSLGQVIAGCNGGTFFVTVKQRKYTDKATKEIKTGFNTLGLMVG